MPPASQSTADIPQPQLHLPALTAKENRAFQLESTQGFPEIVNGRASTNPAIVLDLVKDMATFPDAATVRELQAYGVRTVILHLGLTEGTPQAGAQRKPIAGLPLRRYRLPDRPGLVFYEVGSSSASPGPSEGSRAPGTSGRLSPALAEPDDAQRRERQHQPRDDQPERRAVARIEHARCRRRRSRSDRGHAGPG